MRCPECKSINFVRARRVWWEIPLMLVFSRPFRCEGCLGRMYGFAWERSKPREDTHKKPASGSVRPSAE